MRIPVQLLRDENYSRTHKHDRFNRDGTFFVPMHTRGVILLVSAYVHSTADFGRHAASHIKADLRFDHLEFNERPTLTNLVHRQPLLHACELQQDNLHICKMISSGNRVLLQASYGCFCSRRVWPLQLT